MYDDYDLDAMHRMENEGCSCYHTDVPDWGGHYPKDVYYDRLEQKIVVVEESQKKSWLWTTCYGILRTLAPSLF